ncbi:MAG: hypothetical protein JNM88_18130 [Chitinophagaceae bacterium]|nr:hypothetical protein [Chitinophagaceae bacterium]
MNYRLTPFHGLAFLTIVLMVAEIIDVSKVKGDPGLGGLGPLVLFGLTITILLTDFFIQLTIKSRKWVVISELVLLLAAVLFYYLKFT